MSRPATLLANESGISQKASSYIRRLGLLDAVLQCCTLWLNDRQSLQVFKVRVCVCVCVCVGGGGGSGESSARSKRITDPTDIKISFSRVTKIGK